ncbi:MAG TPA: DUF115 domain-containing protein, partial [Thermoplasmata archaeon]|nr:DUF115 domain-containing protein [Thermoplasmata archaeon]
MDYMEWKPFYETILQEFGYSLEEDSKAAAVLDNLLDGKKMGDIHHYLKKNIAGKDVVVCGAGPSLLKALDTHMELIQKRVLITADGATSAVLKKGLLPYVIVTDLDGYMPDQIKANDVGSVVVVHAHGDNIDALQRYVPKLKGKILGTTQCDPGDYKNLFNFGGFTDGDRAVFLAEYMGAKQVFLIGFDFNGEIGSFSFPGKKNFDVKKRKL